MKWLLAPFVAFVALVLGDSSYRAHARIVAHASESVVRLSMHLDEEDADGHVCTGSMVGRHLVLTAAHCIYQDLQIDDQPIRGVLRLDRFFDLALVDARIEKPSIELRSSGPELYEPLTALGYAHGWHKLTALHEMPYLVNFTPDYGPELTLPPGVFVQGGYIGGMSGGPVVDAQGKMVSIVQRAGELSGYGVGVETIRVFLGGVLE